jgi:hypothetical protein
VTTTDVPQPFSIADVLSVTTGFLFSDMRGVRNVLSWMTGKDLPTYAHVLTEVAAECRPELIRQHPALADVKPPERFTCDEHIDQWLAEQAERYGATLRVWPLARDHVPDPIVEIGPDGIVVRTDLYYGGAR